MFICVTFKLLIMQRTIHHVWKLKHPPETVWEYLTQSELLTRWLMENDFKPIVGYSFQFRTKAITKFGFDGNIYCEVLAVVPQQKLSYSWKGGPGNGIITLDSVVTWTLHPDGTGTSLTLEHAGFKGLKNFMGYFFMNLGWKKKIKKRFIEFLNKKENT